MKAADIMTKNVVTIDSWMTLAEAAKVMQWNNVRALIVNRTSEEDAYGIITQTDLARAIANEKNPETTYIAEVMTKPCIVVNPDLATEHVAKLFAKAKIHIAPVIKERLLGIISLTDILTKTNCLTSTNCLSSIEAELTPHKIENFSEPFKDVSQKDKWKTENDCIYENWCSG